MLSQPLARTSTAQLRSFIDQGQEQGCPRDQLLNFSKAGIILQARQLAASAAARLCDAPDGPTAVGYGGARGGGKTHWLLAQMGADDCQRLPGLRCLLLRKVGKSNLQSFESLRQRLFSMLPHQFAASKGELTFANGSCITLGHYKCEQDIDTYLGLEYDVIGIEEATQLTPRKYEDISTCCRTSKPNWRPRIYSTTNPGGVGHQWYLDKFIIPHQSRSETTTRFIPARVDDNAFINPEYKDNLASRTGWQYDAWYLGRWDFPAGQFFRNFRPDVHVISDDSRLGYPMKWIAAMDYGFTHRTVVLLAFINHLGNTIVIDEHAERHWIPQRHAKAIKEMFARHNVFLSERECWADRGGKDYCSDERGYLDKHVVYHFPAGADMFAKESGGGSVAGHYQSLGIRLTPANMDRVSGWCAILDRFGDPGARIKPTLFIHKRCKTLLETLPYLQHDPERSGDIMKTNLNEEGVGGDDAADALRYLVATKRIFTKVVPVRGW